MTQKPKKRRQRRVHGSILQIDLGDGTFAFGQVLEPPLIAFFDLRLSSVPSLAEIVGSQVAFSIWVMKYAVTRGDWPVIGRVEVPEGLNERPPFFKKDAISGSLSITYTGAEEIPATPEEVAELECAAVWDPEHVEERLSDHFAGRPNKWAESMRP